MRKILSTFAAVALAVPASLALANDPAADTSRRAGEEATQAGVRPGESDVSAETEGTAERAGAIDQKHHQATHQKRAASDGKRVKQAGQAIGELERADPGLTKLFQSASGYAVFATVGKGAIGVGGAHGDGVLYERGQAMGHTTLTQVTVGLALGGQAYTEVIFFETERSLADFKKGEFAMAAQVSAVAAAAGASANARYVDGVSVFTLAKGGLMAEASVGGQKFSYQAFPKPTTSSL